MGYKFGSGLMAVPKNWEEQKQFPIYYFVGFKDEYSGKDFDETEEELEDDPEFDGKKYVLVDAPSHVLKFFEQRANEEIVTIERKKA